MRRTAARAPWTRILCRYVLLRLLMPIERALPPVDYCPEQAQARRRIHGPCGKRLHWQLPRRWQWRRPARSRESAVCGCIRHRISDAFQSMTEYPNLLLDHLPLPQSSSRRLRINGVRSFSAFSMISGIAIRSFAGVLANTIPHSSRKARNWLITAVRRAISRSRTRWIACRSN